MYNLIYIPKNEKILSNVTLDEKFYILNQAETDNALNFEVVESKDDLEESHQMFYALFV